MSKVLFCDSNCELWYTRIQNLGINVISMPYTIDNQEYYYDNGEKTDFKGFYDKVRSGIMPITSALNCSNYIDIFEPYFKNGDEILYISFSYKMSATFEFLNQALEELTKKYPKAKFTRFDTKSISMGAGLQVYLAGKYFQKTKSIPDTVRYLESITDNISTLFMVDNLQHLKRGGRLSASSAFLGSILQIKPILKVNGEGSLFVYSKQKGVGKGIKFMTEEVQTNYKDIDDCPITIVQADCQDLADKLEQSIKEVMPNAEIWQQPVGPTVGTHCGPGTCGVIFPSRSR